MIPKESEKLNKKEGQKNTNIFLGKRSRALLNNFKGEKERLAQYNDIQEIEKFFENFNALPANEQEEINLPLDMFVMTSNECKSRGKQLTPLQHHFQAFSWTESESVFLICKSSNIFQGFQCG